MLTYCLFEWAPDYSRTNESVFMNWWTDLLLNFLHLSYTYFKACQFDTCLNLAHKWTEEGIQVLICQLGIVYSCANLGIPISSSHYIINTLRHY